ncbi:MAG: DUF721 domain-containing protein [Deltaproteobacteria bacterium]|nr:DUF721 domain-containing protein [Deltaproteobacteria bacterium]
MVKKKKKKNKRGDGLKSIAKILGLSFKGLGVKEKVVEHSLASTWRQAVGEMIAKKTKPGRLIGSTLFVNVLNSSWMNTLLYEKSELIEKLNATLGRKQIKDIVFRTGPVENTTAIPSPEKREVERIKRPLSALEEEFIEETTSELKDEKLRELIAKTMAKSKETSRP